MENVTMGIKNCLPSAYRSKTPKNSENLKGKKEHFRNLAKIIIF
jgi:hypothetical protein